MNNNTNQSKVFSTNTTHNRPSQEKHQTKNPTKQEIT